MEIRQTGSLQGGEMAALLRAHGINPTPQRAEIAGILFARPAHFTAERVYVQVNAGAAEVSRATVYNTLGLFVERGLLRQVIVDPNKVFYDSNTDAHHHFYDMETGRLTDIDASRVQVAGLPDLPPGTELDGVDVIVRLRAPSGQ